MKCYKCKTTIPDDADVCPRCGASQGFSSDLIYKAKENDQNAIAELYNKTYSNVYYTIKAIVKDDDAVLDILQDSYLKAFRSLDQLQDTSKFRAWIKRIAHNRAVDYLRQTKAVNFSDISKDDTDIPLEFEDTRPENLPEVVIDQKETARLMAEILDSLPSDQRACVSMFYYEQMSVKEIAEELGVSENTVKSRLNYGRKKIETQVRALEKKGTKMKKFLLSLCMVLALTACKEEKTKAEVKPVVKIGITLPLTGDAADAGQINKKVIELALKEFGNTKYQYNLYFEDDMTTPKKAMLNAVNFTDTKKATAILSMWTPAGMAVSPIADKNKVIHITCAWGYDVAKGKYNFNSSTSFESQVNLLAQKLKKENLTNIAYMVVNTAGCEEQARYAIPFLREKGITFTDIQYYNPTETDFRMLISKMETKHPDYYVLCGIPPSSQIFTQQLQEVTHKRNITSIDTFFEMDSSAWSLIDGLWFINSASGTSEFAAKLKSQLGEEVKSCTANLYDAAHLLIWAFENAKLENGEIIPNTDNVIQKLHEVKNYNGATGNDLWIDDNGILQSQAVLKKIVGNVPIDIKE